MLKPNDNELAEIRRLFRYETEAGALLIARTGKPATKNNGRYIQVRFCGRTVVAHRVVWFLHFGVWPEFEIDHIDGDTFRNHHDNLRPADRSTNMQNVRGPKSSNQLGFLGVKKHRAKYRADIVVNGVNKYLGLHPTPEAAHAAYLKAKREVHPYGQL